MLPGYLKPLFTPQKCSSLTYPLRPYSEAENTEHPLSLTLSPLDIHVWSILEAYQLLDNSCTFSCHFLDLSRDTPAHQKGLCTNSRRLRQLVVSWLSTTPLLQRASSDSGDLAMSTWTESVLALQFSRLFSDIYIGGETVTKSKEWLTEKTWAAVTLEMREDSVIGWRKFGASKVVVIFSFFTWVLIRTPT